MALKRKTYNIELVHANKIFDSMKIKVIFLYIGLFVFLSNAFAQKVEIDGIAYR